MRHLRCLHLIVVSFSLAVVGCSAEPIDDADLTVGVIAYQDGPALQAMLADVAAFFEEQAGVDIGWVIFDDRRLQNTHDLWRVILRQGALENQQVAPLGRGAGEARTFLRR